MNVQAARRAAAVLAVAALSLTGCSSGDGTSDPTPKAPGNPPALPSGFPSGLPSGLPGAPGAPTATGR